jgi:hypothetical protein
MRHLQQLDGLHQLRRHHQGLVLSQEKIGRQGHSGRETPVQFLRETAIEQSSGRGNPTWPKNCFFILFGQAQV